MEIPCETRKNGWRILLHSFHLSPFNGKLNGTKRLLFFVHRSPGAVNKRDTNKQQEMLVQRQKKRKTQKLVWQQPPTCDRVDVNNVANLCPVLRSIKHGIEINQMDTFGCHSTTALHSLQGVFEKNCQQNKSNHSIVLILKWSDFIVNDVETDVGRQSFVQQSWAQLERSPDQPLWLTAAQ